MQDQPAPTTSSSANDAQLPPFPNFGVNFWADLGPVDKLLAIVVSDLRLNVSDKRVLMNEIRKETELCPR
jgi:hypothetical protein